MIKYKKRDKEVVSFIGNGHFVNIKLHWAWTIMEGSKHYQKGLIRNNKYYGDRTIWGSNKIRD